jgi:hypothetical protein
MRILSTGLSNCYDEKNIQRVLLKNWIGLSLYSLIHSPSVLELLCSFGHQRLEQGDAFKDRRIDPKGGLVRLFDFIEDSVFEWGLLVGAGILLLMLRPTIKRDLFRPMS